MKRNLFATFLILPFFSLSSCAWGYSTPYDGEPTEVKAYLLGADWENLYGNETDEENIPFLSRDETYVLRVELPGPFGLISEYISLVYDDEKLELTELDESVGAVGEYWLRVLEACDETTIVVNYNNGARAFGCELLIKA